ncbi:MAG: hypothetical protein ACO22N_08025 [Ilumatobacteraceae bacterium]|jgi:hypothetical protein
MALSTFEGPVKSLGGFYSQGPNTVINLANGTNTVTLDVPTYAGKVIRTNDATLVITLPTIVTTASATSAGPGTDPNTLNNIGTSYTFFIETAATAVSIATDGTDKFVGSILMVATDASGATTGYAPAAANDYINLNGTTTGGAAGSWITCTVLAANKYYVTGVLLGSSTVATPFANS